MDKQFALQIVHNTAFLFIGALTYTLKNCAKHSYISLKEEKPLKVIEKSLKCHPKVIKRSLKGHQRSSKGHQKVIKKSLTYHRKVIERSPKHHRKVTKRSPDGHQKVTGKSLKGHQNAIERQLKCRQKVTERSPIPPIPYLMEYYNSIGATNRPTYRPTDKGTDKQPTNQVTKLPKIVISRQSPQFLGLSKNIGDSRFINYRWFCACASTEQS